MHTHTHTLIAHTKPHHSAMAGWWVHFGITPVVCPAPKIFPQSWHRNVQPSWDNARQALTEREAFSCRTSCNWSGRMADLIWLILWSGLTNQLFVSVRLRFAAVLYSLSYLVILLSRGKPTGGCLATRPANLLHMCACGLCLFDVLVENDWGEKGRGFNSLISHTRYWRIYVQNWKLRSLGYMAWLNLLLSFLL